MTKAYSPNEIEDKWYQYWMDKNYFHSEPDDREPFSIVIPPPNVTGVLHMGHMLDNTIQDILIRKARLQGKNACWVPGTDHASIATEAKVVRMLREQGIKKSDLTREEFLNRAWEWKEKYGGIILQQLKKLGASADWERTAFTMDEVRSQGVIKVFVDLYKKDKLYRGLRMVNWDPEAQTVLSNEEVLHNDENSRLHYVKYKVEGTEDEWITIATTRPETIPGDSAVAVNPNDERYAHLKGKNVIIPIANRVVPIIFDDYVELEFGTGALKVTPAHDVNDYEIGKRHELEVIDVLNADGTMSEEAIVFIGEDRAVARKKVAKMLEEMGQMVKIEDYRHSVGRSERTNAVVEPRLSLQWYVNMKAIAKPALDAVMTDEVEFFPKNQKNTYKHWMDNIRDWCISRQLWWGHRIPAYYYGEETFVAETVEEALSEAREKLGKPDLQLSDLKQDEDVLDTWFSSWLWPISVFDGFENSKDFQYYYPTSVLVTGWDIIFLWVARMIMSGYEWQGVRPFKHVYFHGMVRDGKRRKMSKSLGNSPDALKLIEDYGADGVRFGMLSCAPAGADLLFDEKLCSQGSKFCNKIWNALGLIKGWEVVDTIHADALAANQMAVKWFGNKMQQVLADLEKNFEKYRLSDSLMSLYNFMWNDFFAIYLEIIKPAYGYDKIDKSTYVQTIQYFEQLMIMLHPYMPFVTEEVWHQLKDRAEGEDCIVSAYPTVESFDESLIKDMAMVNTAITSIRDTRNKNQISSNDALPLFIQETEKAAALFSDEGIKAIVIKLANLSALNLTKVEPEGTVSFIVDTEKFYVELNKTIDVEAECKRLKEDLEYQEGFVGSLEKKLSNQGFVNNAPAAIVEKERKKLADGKERIRIIKDSLKKLGC